MRIVVITMLFIILGFSDVINLKKYEKEFQYQESKDTRAFNLAAQYYFGQGLEQNLNKAKQIFNNIKNKDYFVQNYSTEDHFLQIYAKNFKKLVNSNVVPDQDTGVNLVKETLEKFKLNRKSDEWTINHVNQLIQNWNHYESLVFSPNKKSKVIRYGGEFLYPSYGDGYTKDSITEIESPFGKVTFKNFRLGDYDFDEKYIFLDNNKLLIQFGSTTAAGTYILDLVNFDIKRVFGGAVFDIKKFGSNGIINISKKSYLEKGGAFWYLVSYDFNGNSIKNKTLNDFMISFDSAHNKKNFNKLSNFYLNNISYYNAKRYSKNSVIKDKKRFLKKYKNFNMKSQIMGLEQQSENDFIIHYKKAVTYGKNNRKFDSYLKVIIKNNNVYIKEENDHSPN